MKKALMSIIWAIVVMALVVSCATKAAAPEAEKAPAAVEVEKKAETPAPAKEEAPAAAKAVALEMNGTKTEYATIEESVEVQTESVSVKINGDSKTGMSKVVYGKDSAGFDTLFTNPPAPTLPAESGSGS